MFGLLPLLQSVYILFLKNNNMESEKYSSFEEEKNNPQKEENGSKRDQSNKKAGFNFGRLFFGFIIVSLGLFYLAKNTGHLPLDLDDPSAALRMTK